MPKKVWILFLVSLFILTVAGCHGGGGGGALPAGAQLTAIEVTPGDSSIAVDTTQQFKATGIYSDNSKRDLTADVQWSSSDMNVAVVGASASTLLTGLSLSGSATIAGNIVGLAEGTTTIKASSGGITGAGSLKVKRAKLVSIAVTPTNPAAAKGTSQQFTATGTFSDNTTQDLTAIATWSSSNTLVAGISNIAGSTGLAAPLTAGSTTITATWTSISGSTTLTVNSAALVSLQVTPTNPAVAKGTGVQFTATGLFSDNTTQDLTATVTWSSSDTGVATISNAAGSNGLATSSGTGSTTITAASGSVTGSTALTVSPATLASIAVTPVNAGIAKGTTQQFAAIGAYSDNTTQNLTASVTWSSSSTTVATISNAAGSNGLATAAAGGSTTITAAYGSISGSTTLTVNPATLVSLSITPISPGIAKGTKQQFTATGTYSDNTAQNLTASVTWSSASTAVATVSNAAGSNGLAASMAAGTTTIKAVSGSISGSTILTVTPAILVSLTLSPVNPTVAIGTSQQFTATGTYSDTSTQNLTAAVTWTSANTATATISNAAGSNGLATPVATGTTTIKAASGSVTASTALTVADRSASLSWDPATTNTDGTPLTDLAGYKLHYGTSSGNYTASVSVGAGTSYVLSNLAAGTYYFTVTTVNTGGVESAYSNEVSKTIQ